MTGNILKKILFAVVIVMAVFGTSRSEAQTHYSSNVSVGIKGGMDFSRVFFSPSVKQSFQPGVTFGATFRYIEENHFGLIGEVNFVQRGWKEDFEGAPYEYKATTNYVEIPILAHIYFGNRGRFFFNAGPQVAFFLGESRKTNFDPNEIGKLQDFPANRTYYQWSMDLDQKIDYGISAGLGGEFSISHRNALYLEARFYYGLGNIFKAGRYGTFRASNQMTVSATVGYWFRIK